jgi:hypothetical protein
MTAVVVATTLGRRHDRALAVRLLEEDGVVSPDEDDCAGRRPGGDGFLDEPIDGGEAIGIGCAARPLAMDGRNQRYGNNEQDPSRQFP